MVFGNLATGYWLGAAAAAGLHWVELGRKILTGTGDTIDVYGSALTPTTTSSGGTLNLTSGGTTVLSTISTGTTSDEKWVLRFKANFGTWAANSYFHVCLADNDNTITAAQDELGILWRNDTGGNKFGVHSVANANPNSVDAQDKQTWSTSTSTNYYFEIVRESSTSAKAKFYGTDSTYTTVSSTSSMTVSAASGGFDRIKIMANNSTNTTGAVTISDIKFYNNTTLVTPLTAKPYMMVLQQTFPSSTSIQERTRVNSDSGSNYASRQSISGGSDFTNTSRNAGYEYGDGQNHPNNFSVTYVNNIADQEKLAIHSWIGADTGAGTAPIRAESVGKWTNTSDSITSWNAYNANSSADFAVGSEVVVLGYDPDDEEGTSVWEELADVELSSGTSNTINTGTIDAKKYLYLQFYSIPSGSQSYSVMRFNLDEGNNYASRYSTNGGSDATGTSNNYVLFYAPLNQTERFMSAFIINKSDKEKLVIGEGVSQNTAGAGNAPERRELTGKWANTSSSITSVQIHSDSDDDNPSRLFAAGTRLKVWGFD